MKKYFYSRSLFDGIIVKYTNFNVDFKLHSSWSNNVPSVLSNAISFTLMDIGKQL